MRIKEKYWYLFSRIFLKKRLGKLGKKSRIIKPIQLDDISSVVIGENVYIAEGAWIMGNKDKSKTLDIGSNTSIGHFSHIIAKQSICIEERVLIADKVFITDCTHSYKNIHTAVIDDDIVMLKDIIIGEGSWLCENVCICGANVGKHCVIGANSVVTSDIPDYSVAVGTPAKVIKKYNFDNNQWQNV